MPLWGITYVVDDGCHVKLESWALTRQHVSNITWPDSWQAQRPIFFFFLFIVLLDSLAEGPDINNKFEIKIKILLTINYSVFISKIYSLYTYQYLLIQIKQYFVSTHEKQFNWCWEGRNTVLHIDPCFDLEISFSQGPGVRNKNN